MQQIHFSPGGGIEIDTLFGITIFAGNSRNISLAGNPLQINKKRIAPESGKGGIG